MNGIMRILLALLAIALAFALSMLLVMVDCGLEPSICENVSFISKLPIPLLLVSPIIISDAIPSKYKRSSAIVRYLSCLLLLFPLMATIKNTIAFILSPDLSFSDFLFGPISASLVVAMLILLLWPAIKHLTSGSTGQI